MLIAQITDIHLGFEKDDPQEPNRRRLDTVLSRLAAMDARPDLLLMTGDLAETGDADAYRSLKEATAALPFPAYPAVGNHDAREVFAGVFPEFVSGGFVQYEVAGGPLRILVLDTLDAGRHGGGFCEMRADWLARRLREDPSRPTLVALHHPPVNTGLSWLSESADSDWMRRLEAVVAGHDCVIGMVAGHLHRPVVTSFAGTTLTVSAATAAQLALDLGTIDPETPDGRPLVVDEPPAFALHLWTGGSLVTHFGRVGDDPVLARFDERMQPLVRLLAEERRGAS
jgi:Icc protein